jgi:hypothetical protein
MVHAAACLLSTHPMDCNRVHSQPLLSCLRGPFWQLCVCAVTCLTTSPLIPRYVTTSNRQQQQVLGCKSGHWLLTKSCSQFSHCLGHALCTLLPR